MILPFHISYIYNIIIYILYITLYYSIRIVKSDFENYLMKQSKSDIDLMKWYWLYLLICKVLMCIIDEASGVFFLFARQNARRSGESPSTKARLYPH